MSPKQSNLVPQPEDDTTSVSRYSYVSSDGVLKHANSPASSIESFWSDYYNVAIQRFNMAREMHAEMLELKQRQPEVNVNDFTEVEAAASKAAEWLDRFSFATVLHKESCLVAIVFSALSLEGLVNLYVVQQLSAAYLAKNLDRLDPITKLVVAIRCVTGKDLSRGEHALQLMAELVGLRNALVHFKPSIRVLGESDHAARNLSYDSNAVDGPTSPAEWMQRAQRAVDTLPEMERAIQQVDTSWHGHGCREIYDIHVVGKAEKRVDTKGTLQLILGNILKRKQAAKSPTNLADRQAK